MRWGAIVVGVALVCATLASCSAAADTAPGTLSVVTSTNVYGSIVEQIAGRLAGSEVRVTSIISDSSRDPHSFEASTRTELAIYRADLVVENGGGYDDFVDSLRKAAHAKAAVLNVVKLAGARAGTGDQLNEHVWYDFPTVERLANRVAAFLVNRDHNDAATFEANARSFVRRLKSLEATEARINAAHAGEGVAITEPVPLYLLGACGLVNRTPEAFSRSVEDGTDVAPRVLQETRALFTDHRVRLLVYNDQTGSNQTEEVLTAARDHDVPAVPVGEVVPEGMTYLSWMRGTLAQISAGLR